MIKTKFQSFVGPESVRLSGGQIHIAVQPLHDARGKLLLRLEVVYYELLVLPDASGELLDGVELRAHRPEAPLAQVPANPMGAAVAPQRLEGFLEQVGAHALEVVLHDILELGSLLVGEVFGALREAVLGVLEHALVAVGLEPPGLGRADLAERLVEVGDNVEAVQEVKGMRQLLGDHLEVGLPHVRADVADARGAVRAEHAEEAQQGLDGAPGGDVKPAAPTLVDLVDQGGVVVPLALAPLVHADGPDALEVAMPQAGVHHALDRAEHAVPADPEGFGDLLPAHALGPAGEEELAGLGYGALALDPSELLDLHPAARAVHAPHAVGEVELMPPQRHELEAPLPSRGVVDRGLAPAARAGRPGAFSRKDGRDYAMPVLRVLEADLFVDKALERKDLVEQSLQLHRRPLLSSFFTPYDAKAPVRLSTSIGRPRHCFSEKSERHSRCIGRSGGQGQSRIKSPACGTEPAMAGEFMPRLPLLAA